MSDLNNREGGLNGEQRLILLLCALAAISVFGLVLLMALWAYKEIVALSLFGLFGLFVVVHLWGKWNEQNIRLVRYRHNEETPLMMPPYPSQIQGMQSNQYYIPSNQRQEVKF